MSIAGRVTNVCIQYTILRMMQARGEEMSAASYDSLVASVRSWVSAWGDEVASVDLDAGRRRFDPDAVAFGTRADVVSGLDHIASEQWGHVWAKIADFSFVVDDLVVQIADDASLAVAIVPWTSTGFDQDGTPFDRPGRATVVLRPRRADENAGSDWLAIHTHFSLALDTPSHTYGRPSGDGT